jgi:hypothetical protein
LTWDLIVEDLQPWQSGASVDSISGGLWRFRSVFHRALTVNATHHVGTLFWVRHRNCYWCLHLDFVLAAKATGAASQGCRLCLPQAGTWRAKSWRTWITCHIALDVVWISNDFYLHLSTNLEHSQGRPERLEMLDSGLNMVCIGLENDRFPG